MIGQQFSWTFDYGATTSGTRIRSYGTLYLPANTDVGLDVISTDPPCNAQSGDSFGELAGAGDLERGLRCQPQLLRAGTGSADERDPR